MDDPSFSKPPLTLEAQVALLEERGMNVPNRDEAKFYLQHLNYYRLVGYWLPFESNHATHRFRVGTSFPAVLNLYTFDRELRLIVLDAVERVEVSVRSQWAYEFAHRHGPHGYLDRSLAKDPHRFTRNLEVLRDEVRRSDETFIRHFRGRYPEELPPIWAVCEVMSLGQLSKWFSNLRPMKTRRAVAKCFRTDEAILQSWLHHLTYVRNLCAHHSRLWNRDLTIIPKLPRTKPSHLRHQMVGGSRRVYNTLTILAYLLDIISPQHSWRFRVLDLIDRHAIDVSQMDFPEGWLETSVWAAR